jgi:hypothetical protein
LQANLDELVIKTQLANSRSEKFVVKFRQSATKKTAGPPFLSGATHPLPAPASFICASLFSLPVLAVKTYVPD